LSHGPNGTKEKGRGKADFFGMKICDTLNMAKSNCNLPLMVGAGAAAA